VSRVWGFAHNPFLLVGNGDDGVDDDRNVQGRRALSRSRPRVASVFAPQVDDEVAEGVHDLGFLVEIRRGLNVSNCTQPSCTPIEIAELLLKGRERATAHLAAEGGKQMPALGEKLGVKILATYVPMTNHMVFVAVEADDANAVREFQFQGRLAQWNTIEIYQTSTLEEALTRVQELPTIY
jgi:hypothetical protein